MKLIIPANIEKKLNAYVQGVDAEIAGMGACEVRDDGNIYVTDIAIYEQVVTHGTADLSSQALAKFQTELVKRGDSPKNWYLWWHSHNTMQSFFSKTDTDTIDSSTEFDYLVSLVVNKRRERKCRVDYHRPFRMYLDNVPVEVAPEVTPETIAIDAKISELRSQITQLYAEKSNVIASAVEDVSDEIKAKVTIKTYSKPIGFNSTPALPYKSSVPKKDIAVPDEDVTEVKGLDIDEVDLIIEQTRSLINAHVANGNGDTVECEELRNDLEDYLEYRKELLWGADYDYATCSTCGKYDPNFAHDHRNDDDELGLPPLPNGYRYGFNK